MKKVDDGRFFDAEKPKKIALGSVIFAESWNPHNHLKESLKWK